MEEQRTPSLSVVVAYDMARELPRTLRSLAPPMQTGIAAADYEIVVVDNGSPEPVDARVGAELEVEVRVLRIDDASPSPGRPSTVGLRSRALRSSA